MEKYKKGDIKSYNDWVDAIEIADSDVEQADEDPTFADSQETQRQLGTSQTVQHEDSAHEREKRASQKHATTQQDLGESPERNAKPVAHDSKTEYGMGDGAFDKMLDDHIDWKAMAADGLNPRGGRPFSHDGIGIEDDSSGVEKVPKH